MKWLDKTIGLLKDFLLEHSQHSLEGEGLYVLGYNGMYSSLIKLCQDSRASFLKNDDT